MASAEAAQMPFIRNLASSDRKLRTQSLSTLQAYLSSRTELPGSDALKLWTGLYYALWMTDRPRPQQLLATDLANLLFDLQPGCVIPFLTGFWAVLSKQWASIDALRMDKFLFLVRRVFAAQVRFAREKKWTGSQVNWMLDLLKVKCFDVNEEKGVALGLRLHVLDLWVDELEREKAIGAEAQDEDENRQRFLETLGNAVETLRRSPVKAVRTRAAESYEDERLPWVEKVDDEMEDDVDDDEDEDGWGGIKDDE